MVAQQVHRLVNELGLVLQAGGLITPAQLLQNLLSCRLTHVFIHSGQGNPTFGTTYRLTALSTPSRVTKLLAQFARRILLYTFLAPGRGLRHNDRKSIRKLCHSTTSCRNTRERSSSRMAQNAVCGPCVRMMKRASMSFSSLCRKA